MCVALHDVHKSVERAPDIVEFDGRRRVHDFKELSLRVLSFYSKIGAAGRSGDWDTIR